MARVVCQVLHNPDQLTFLWSDGTASFAPYHLTGSHFQEFQLRTERADELLRDMAGASAPPTGDTALRLAEAGHHLHEALFQADAGQEEGAREIRNWLDRLARDGSLDALEFLGDGAAQVPWNFLCEGSQDEDSLRAGAGSPEGWQAFWGARYPLVTGHRVNPLRRRPVLTGPSTLIVLDAGALPADRQGSLREFARANGLTVVETAPDLADQLKAGTPYVLYLFCRLRGDALLLGDQAVPAADLRRRLRGDRTAGGGRSDAFVFLNACRGGDEEPVAAVVEALGCRASLAPRLPVAAEIADQVGLEFLTGFLTRGEPVGRLLHQLHARHAPVSLLYTACCPPDLRVIAGPPPEEAIQAGEKRPAAEGAASGPPPLEPLALPDHPYFPLLPYDSQDRPLFVGRDEDAEAFAEALDAPGVRLAVLHGPSGVGKASLLRAGVIPYLEEECTGYRALRDRSPPEEEEDEEEGDANEDDYPVLAVRATSDLAGQLALALSVYCAQPYRYTTPTGATVEVDLSGILDATVGARPAAGQESAIKAAEAVGAPAPGGPPPLPPEAESPGVEDIRLALRQDVSLLGRILTALTERLPHELVVVIEQGEELFSLANRLGDTRQASRPLAVLKGLMNSAANIRVIVSLMTEYHGRLLQPLVQEPAERARVCDYLLRELDRDEMVQAVLRPTATGSLPGCSEVPHEVYRFRFEEGVAEAIAREAFVAQQRRRQSPLVLLQVICAQLYRVALRRPDRVVRMEDFREVVTTPSWWRAPGLSVSARIFFAPAHLFAPVKPPTAGSGATLAAYVEYLSRDVLVGRSGSDRAAFQRLLEMLQFRQPDGTAATDLAPEEEILKQWRGATPFETILERAAARDVRLLEEDWLDVEGKEGRYVSLGHPALAPAVAEQAEEARRREYAGARIADTLWVMIPLLILVGVFAWTRMRAVWATEAGTKENESLYNKLKDSVKVWQTEAEGSRWPLYAGHVSQAREALRTGDLLRARQYLVAHRPLGDEEDIRGFEWWYLWRQLDGARHNLLGHLGQVTAVAVGADGKVVASASTDGTVKLWDAASGEIRATLRKHRGAVNAIAFAPKGGPLATAGADGAVLLWDAAAGQEKYTDSATPRETLGGDKGEVLHALAFAPDGKTLAAAGANGTLKLWDVGTAGKEKERAALDGGKATVYALAFAPDGKTLAVGGAEAGVKLWDVSTAGKEKVRETLKGTNAPVRGLAYALDGKTLAAGGEESKDGFPVGFVRLWDAAGKELATLNPVPAAVASLAFSADGKTLATGGKDDAVRLWDAVTGRPQGVLRGHLGWAGCVAFSPDGKTLVSGGYDRTVKLWSPGGNGTDEVLHGHKDWVNGVAFSPDDKRLASCGADGSVRLWDVTTGKEEKVLEGHKGAVLAVAYGPDGKTVASAGADGTVRLWDVDAKSKSYGAARTVLKEHKGAVHAVAFFTPGKYVASGASDGGVRLWDADRDSKDYGKLLHTFEGHRGAVRCVTFLSPLPILASGGADRTVRIWSVEALKPAGRPLEGHTAEVRSLAYWAPAKKYVASASADRTVKLWDVQDGKESSTLRGHTAAVNGLTFNPADALLLATAGADGTVRLWNPATAGERFALTGHEEPVQAVALSSDGGTLASAGRDGTVRLWRAPVDAAPMPGRK